MPFFVPVTQQRHGTKRWKRHSNHSFAAAHIFAPLAFSELAHAVLSLPMGFMAQGEGYVLGAILGLKPAENLLVAPDGRWLGTYVPAAFRAYPFLTLPGQDGQEFLCIDEDSGLVVDGPDGELFFEPDGSLSASTNSVLVFLQKVNSELRRIRTICSSLKDHGLIQPWPIALQQDGRERQVVGVHRIDEEALNNLPVKDLLEIRDAGGLGVAYSQLFSMLHVRTLTQVASARAEAGTALSKFPVTPSGELDLEFLNNDASLNFGRLK